MLRSILAKERARESALRIQKRPAKHSSLPFPATTSRTFGTAASVAG